MTSMTGVYILTVLLVVVGFILIIITMEHHK